MTLPAGSGNTIAASDLYQLCQPSGAQEKGSYYLAGWANAVNDTLSYWEPSQSRVSTPVSVSIDTSILAATGVNAPTTAHLNANGFAIGATATGAGVNIGAGGAYTIQY